MAIHYESKHPKLDWAEEKCQYEKLRGIKKEELDKEKRKQTHAVGNLAGKYVGVLLYITTTH